MMLASTVQFSRYGRSRFPSATRAQEMSGPSRGLADWRPFPQDPTACSARTNSLTSFPSRLASSRLRGRPAGVLTGPGSCPNRITSAPLTSDHPGTFVRKMVLDAHPR